MEPDSGRRSFARSPWLLIGAVAVYLVGFSLLENLVREEPRPPTSAEDATGLISPAAPQVRRLDDGGVEIRHDYFRRTTVRLDDEDATRALFDCLTKGFEQTFGGGVEGWGRARIQSETRRALNECLAPHGLPAAVPAPPDRDGVHP